MASDFTRQSSAPIHIPGSVEMQSAYNANPGGNEFAFEPDLSIDTMMQPNQFASPSIGGFPDASHEAFADILDPSMSISPVMQSGAAHYQPSEPGSSLPDNQSPSFGQHRQSFGSGVKQLRDMRPGSFGGSDSRSPSGVDGMLDSQMALSNEENYRTEDQSGAAPPSWSELKTKAGKERKRLPLACIACRRKKIRCSGEKPACRHCLRSRIPCVYKVTTRKAAPRTDYMAMLDKRLKRMEERVIKAIPKDEQGIVNSTGRAVVKPPLPPAAPKSAGTQKKRQAEQAFGDELDDWAFGRDVDRPATADTAAQADTNRVDSKPSDEQTLLLEGSDQLPSKELQQHLAEVYFEFVYGQSYHLLHKPSFMRKLAHGAVPPVLVLAVCAISARFSNHPAVRTEPVFLRGEDWARAARKIALKRYDTPNITILIVYLLLGLHEFGTCQGGRSWMFGGMAQRMAYALQLHKDLDRDPKERAPDAQNELTFTDREIRRRTMWSCFIMDRFNSSGTDRPIFVGEQYIRAQLPIKEKHFQMEVTGPTEDLDGHVPNPTKPGEGELFDAMSNMGVAAYLIRLVSIYGKVVTYQNQGGKESDAHPMWSEQSKFQRIKREVEQWKAKLPSWLEYSLDNLQNHASEKTANQYLFMHIVHQQILLFMHRFALPAPGSRTVFPRDMPEEFVADAARTAVDSASRISGLVHEAMDHRVVAPFAGYSAFASSTVHIYGAFSKDPEIQATSKQNLAWSVKYLTKMKKYWGMFHFVTENLRDLYRRYADAARSGGKDSKDGDQPIFQYGDWFDRYPHGVSGTDYEEPSIEPKKEPGSDGVLGQKSDLQTVEEFFSKLSPPSKSVHVQSQQSRKAAKKRRPSKLDSYTASVAMNGEKQSRNVAPGNSDQQQTAVQQMQQDSVSQQDLVSQQAFGTGQNLSGFLPPQSSAFPPGSQLPNPLNMGQPQQYLSQLDRQMVLNSYAGLANTNPNMQANMNAMLDNPGLANFTDFDYNTSQAGQPNGNGFWGDPSTAWFMPFNMDPPTMAGGEDNGTTFGGGFDSFSGLGDVNVGMGAPVPLPVDMDPGPGGTAGQPGVDGMET